MDTIRLRIEDTTKSIWAGPIFITLSQKSYDDPELKKVILTGKINQELQKISLFRYRSDQLDRLDIRTVTDEEETREKERINLEKKRALADTSEKAKSEDKDISEHDVFRAEGGTRWDKDEIAEGKNYHVR